MAEVDYRNQLTPYEVTCDYCGEGAIVYFRRGDDIAFFNCISACCSHNKPIATSRPIEEV